MPACVFLGNGVGGEYSLVTVLLKRVHTCDRRPLLRAIILSERIKHKHTSSRSERERMRWVPQGQEGYEKGNRF